MQYILLRLVNTPSWERWRGCRRTGLLGGSKEICGQGLPNMEGGSASFRTEGLGTDSALDTLGPTDTSPGIFRLYILLLKKAAI